jgi:SAM-dependent methyltransferase
MLVFARTLLLAALVATVGCHEAVELAEPGAQAPAAAPGRQQPAPDPGTIDRPTSTPYSGDLSIFEGEGRDERLQVDRVMDVLKIGEGSAVADIGAGSGWFTVRAARRAGATGTVYAVDINDKYLEHIAERARTEGLANVRTVLGAEDDPKLPASSVDAVLILKTYHEFSEPVRIMRHVAAAVRPSGLVGIIDKKGDGDDHGIDEKVVVEEMKRAGFELAERHDFVGDDMDYFLVFRRSR